MLWDLQTDKAKQGRAEEAPEQEDSCAKGRDVPPHSTGTEGSAQPQGNTRAKREVQLQIFKWQIFQQLKWSLIEGMPSESLGGSTGADIPKQFSVHITPPAKIPSLASLPALSPSPGYSEY